MNNRQDTFISMVEVNDRSWGNETYADRPTLERVLNAPIVVFWKLMKTEPGYRVTCHDTLTDLHIFASTMFLRPIPVDRRIARVYVQQKRVKVKGVKVILASENPS